MRNRIICFVFCLIMVCSLPVAATELVYTPVSPSFGGNALNGNWLLSQAESQRSDPPISELDEDLLEDFENNLTRQVLYQLSSRIVDTAFGDYDDDLNSGHYDFGNYSIDIDAGTGNAIGVTILDTISGGSTTVEVPYYK